MLPNRDSITIGAQSRTSKTGWPRHGAAWTITLLLVAALCIAVPPAISSDSAVSSDSDKDKDKEQGLSFADGEMEDASESALEEVQAISEDIQSLKSRVIALNKDLRLMEEKLLFPSNTQYSVFVSLSGGRFFDLESVKFKLDGEMVASHIYSEKQRDALNRGGIHRLYVTNLNEGKHSATVFFTGIGSNERPYKRAVSMDFDKGAGSGYLEIAIDDDVESQEPRFELKQR